MPDILIAETKSIWTNLNYDPWVNSATRPTLLPTKPNRASTDQPPTLQLSNVACETPRSEMQGKTARTTHACETRRLLARAAWTYLPFFEYKKEMSANIARPQLWSSVSPSLCSNSTVTEPRPQPHCRTARKWGQQAQTRKKKKRKKNCPITSPGLDPWKKAHPS